MVRIEFAVHPFFHPLLEVGCLVGAEFFLVLFTEFYHFLFVLVVRLSQRLRGVLLCCKVLQFEVFVAEELAHYGFDKLVTDELACRCSGFRVRKTRP